MQEMHKTLIQTLQPMLIDNINVDVLIPHLRNKNILSREVAETISSKVTPKDRCIALLSILPTRGPSAFSAFIDSLRLTNQSDLANTLMDDNIAPVDMETRERRQNGNSNIMKESNYRPHHFMKSEQIYRTLHYKASSTVMSPASIVSLQIQMGSKENGISPAMERNPAVQTLPPLVNLDAEALPKRVSFVVNHTALSDGFLTVVTGTASDDAGALFTKDNTPISLNLHLAQPIVRCHNLSGRPKLFFFLLHVDEKIRDLASFYRNLGHDCFVVIYRRKKDSPFPSAIVKAMSQIIESLGREPITSRILMTPLLDVSSPDLVVINTLQSD